MTAVRVRVPASTANLGSGFDTMGMALALYDVVEAEIVDDGLAVDIVDTGAGGVDALPRDESHLVVRAVRHTADRIGLKIPGLRLTCANAIPHARGLGSSAAAVVAGAAAAYGLAGRPLDRDAVLQLAAGFEGHADNAGASLLGGVVITWMEGARWQAARLEPHPQVRPVIAIAEEKSSTAATRGLLPETVPHADAAHAAARAALGVHALTTDPSLLLPGTEDRLHQQYRAPAYPRTAALVQRLRERGVAAAVSGAGPSVLALTSDGRLPDDVDTEGFRIKELPVDMGGVTVAAA
ncbi:MULTISPECIES: homoserine kinase [Thermocrispum]|uniref:Homoserine kinase n=2 Tax=Thermocrispum agreste TaxID=37925 RepID=A0ABD6FFW2_9PSEU|nr:MULTISPECIES: homoserine kinase [Thermocrispum]